MGRIACEVCNQYEAVVKDYRWYDEGVAAGNPWLVCKYCLRLNDVAFDMVLKSQGELDPKRLLDDPCYPDWDPDWDFEN